MNNTYTIPGFTVFARKAAAEGMVLLKNDNNMFPIKDKEEIAVFGRCQIDYYRSGTGSGGSVNVAYSVNALEGIVNNGHIRLNRELADIYEQFVKENPFDNGGGGWAAEPWFQQEMELTDEILLNAKKTSVKAIVIIGRTAGEEQDNKDTEGSYRLTEGESNMLRFVTQYFEQVAVVLNVSNILDMSWLDNVNNNNNIKAVLYSWHGGMEGGNALADILSGEVVPSGKLTDTIAYDIVEYPSHKNFGDEIRNVYEEDVYLGYRFFETFNKKAVRYPFGFGLSYTDFETKIVESKLVGSGLDQNMLVKVIVTNIGSEYSGREIIQLYYSAPQGLLGKPALQLGGFVKTRLLKANESDIVEITLPLIRMASYDDSGVTGNKSCYVLEAGDYGIFIGNSIRSLTQLLFDNKSFNIKRLIVVEQLNEALSPVIEFKRLKPGELKENGEYTKSYEPVPKRVGSLEERIKEWTPKSLVQTGNKGIVLKDVKHNKASMEAFISQLSQEDLEVIVRGEGMSSPKVTSGTAGAFGGVGDSLLAYGIPVACASDGPSGIRMDSGEEAVQVPIGTLLACSWDVDLVEELYVYEGKELRLNNIDTLLGPGMNIHRHPLNGRNFEYFSEDPLLTGEMAKACVVGINKSGAHGTIKHFACNDQEHYRRKVDSVLSERALREIHLKGFEIAIKEGKARSVMTSYNPINGIWAASNYDLNTTILRKEWGYSGLVMTDWWAAMNDTIHGGVGSMQQMASMVKSQNDVYMLVNNDGAQVNSNGDDLSESISNGSLTIGELQQCAMNICEFIINSPVIERELEIREIKTVTPLSYSESVSRDANNCSKHDTLNIKMFETGVDIDLGIKEDHKIMINVVEPGQYNFIVNMKYEQEPSAQSACAVTLNGEYISNIQINGTRGRWFREKNMTLMLEKGMYELEITFTKPGLEVGFISLIQQLL